MKIVKVFGVLGSTSCSWSYTSSVIAAAEACRDAGAKIITMSLGRSSYISTEDAGFTNLLNDDDVLSIAAAGNGGNSGYSYPASNPNVMSVGCTKSDNSM
eukprot:15110795-Ditylum_brightwellii.AAC.1